MVIQTVGFPDPSLRDELVRVRENIRVPSGCVVIEDKKGLQRSATSHFQLSIIFI
jgi:hypothetical protein